MVIFMREIMIVYSLDLGTVNFLQPDQEIKLGSAVPLVIGYVSPTSAPYPDPGEQGESVKENPQHRAF